MCAPSFCHAQQYFTYFLCDSLAVNWITMPSLAPSPTRSEPSPTLCTCETHNPSHGGLLHWIKVGVWLAAGDVWVRFCEEEKTWKPCCSSHHHRHRCHRHHLHHRYHCLCASIRGLSNNRLEGRIPSSIGSLPSLVTLWVVGAAHRQMAPYAISGYLLAGRFQLNVFVFPSYSSFDSFSFSFKFREHVQLCSHGGIFCRWNHDRDLSRNQFSGRIPASLGRSPLNFL